MLTDLRFAFRQLLKSPGYSLVVVLTLALGIAVNTNIFGMLNMFFLQNLPVPHPEQLVLVLQKTESWRMPHGPSFPDFKDYRDRLKSVGQLSASQPTAVHLSATGQSPQRAWIEMATPNTFAALGVQAQVGRVLVPSDGEEKGEAVFVLSDDCWRSRFGADPHVVNRVVTINGRNFTVIGVAAPEFHSCGGMLSVAGWISTGSLDQLRDNGSAQLTWRGAAGWRVIGRLYPGFSLADAKAESAVALAQLTKEYPETHHDAQSLVLPESRARPDPILADYMPVFAALFAALVALVLFIACANVTNLMLARATTRQRELTVRASLGASRARLMRQLLVESLLLAALAGLVGWLLAGWIGESLRQFAPQGDMPVRLRPSNLWQGNVFTLVVSLLAGLASGIFPALRASRVNLVDDLKDGAGGRLVQSRHWLRNALVVGQVTFSLVVLICAGLFLRSLRQVEKIDIGFRSERLLLASYDLGLQGYNEKRGKVFNRELLARVKALNGVQDAALTGAVPFDYQVPQRPVAPVDPTPTLRDGTMSAGFYAVTPGFIEMLGLRMRSGRTLAETDRADTTSVAVVNVAFAEACWPGRNPIGQRFAKWKGGPLIEVVGLAETAKYMMLSEPPRPVFYVPLEQDYQNPVAIAVRTKGDPTQFAAALRDVVKGLDPHLPLFNVRSMDELMGNSVFAFMPFRMGAMLASVQGAIGLSLAVMGLYAVVAFGVSQRTREIGIRIALGAQPTAVLRSVLTEGIRLTAIGLAVGLVIAAALNFLLSRFLQGLAGFDVLTFIVFTALLVGVSAFACWWPARRAVKIDPVVALRTE